MYEHDTIAAIATPPGQGGIAVIRVSGVDAESIVRQLFFPQTPWETLHSHHFYLGKILDRPNGRALDHAGLLLMRAPHSYTGEHIAELHLHGGSFLTRRVLEALLNQGARLAQPGEFTKRAFLNGRIDLIQAEAVGDLIQANNETGLHLAWEDLSGRLSQGLFSHSGPPHYPDGLPGSLYRFPGRRYPRTQPKRTQLSLLFNSERYRGPRRDILPRKSLSRRESGPLLLGNRMSASRACSTCWQAQSGPLSPRSLARREMYWRKPCS